MTSNPQLDFHPDIEALSAFAEHLLPEHERQPILAHLATCARCRQILFLAQDANPDSENQAQSVPAGPVLLPNLSRKRPPLRNWPLAWGALAACAALVAVSIFLYPRHSTPPQQQTAHTVLPQQPAPTASGVPGSMNQPLAQSRPEPQRRVPASPSAQAARVKPMHSPATAAGSASGGAIGSIRAAAPQAQASAPVPQISNSAAPIAQASETVEVSAAETVAIPQSANQTVTVDVSSQSVLAQPAPPAVTATIPARQILPSDQLALKDRAVKPLEPTPPSATPGSTSIHGFAMGHAGASGERLSAPRAALAKMAPRPLAVLPEDEAATRNTLQKTLPSGLPAVSAVSASHHLLALDSAGTLFLSEDAGSVWEIVPQTWTGRAILVSIPPVPTNPQGVAAPAAPGQNKPTIPPADKARQPLPHFEIVTDLGARWTSDDGHTWKSK